MLYKVFMARQQTIGLLGEDTAASYLQGLGYIILERNWRFSKAEIDIICKDQDVLVFVEVKSKSYTFFGEPEDSVSVYKETLIIDAANRYMEKVAHDWVIRFDIVSILFDKKRNPNITHFKDAFFPGIS